MKESCEKKENKKRGKNRVLERVKDKLWTESNLLLPLTSNYKL